MVRVRLGTRIGLVMTSLFDDDRELSLPESLGDAEVLLPRTAGPTRCGPEALSAALARAASTAAKFAGSRGHIALIVPDRTRPLPLPALLPPLLGALDARGIAMRRVVIVPASGIHRPMGRAELASWVGEDAARSAGMLAPHDCDAPCRRVGTTTDGISVAVHPAVATAAALLVVGRIVFHYLAGFGGGRKMLVPGVASRGTVLAVHARCLGERADTGRHPRARAGVLDGNPVNEAALGAALCLPPAIALHITLAASGALESIEAGDLLDDHRRACGRFAAHAKVFVEAPFDGAIVATGSRAASRDLVQAHKALDAVAPIVRDGGVVLLVARCEDGVGNEEVSAGLRLQSMEALERRLRERFSVGGHTALALLEKTTRLRVLALTNLDAESCRLAKITPVRTWEEGLRAFRAAVGPRARIAVAPSGASLLYRCVSDADVGL